MKSIIYKLAIPAFGAAAAFSAVLVAAPSSALAWPMNGGFNTSGGCPSAQTYYSNGYSNVYCVPSFYPGYPQTPSIYPGVGNGFQNGYAYPTYQGGVPGTVTPGGSVFVPSNGSPFYPSGQVSPFYPQTNPFQQPVYNQPFYPYTPVPQYYYPPAPTYGWHY